MDEPVDALAKLDAAVKRAKRTSSVGFPISFVRREGEPPMLSRLMRGGRGGQVRLRLYLTLRMQATSHPYHLPGRTSRSLAVLLNLPKDTGPRQVTDALNWLEENRLLKKRPKPGRPPSLTLLKPDYSGDDWPAGMDKRYVTLPLELWTLGWILKMNGRSLAVYAALRELTGGTGRDGAVMPGARKVQYGMSDDTWTRATKELRDLGILVTISELQGDDEYDVRRRQRYWLRDLGEVGKPYW